MSNTIEATVSHRFNASPKQVFDAWLDPETVRQWMALPFEPFDGGTMDVRRVEIDARVGGRFTFSDMREEGEATHWGTYLEIDRPRKLVFTWFMTAEAERDYTSVVTLAIRRDRDGCVAEVTHQLDARWTDLVEKCQQGWRGMLVQIDTFLLSGEAH